MTSTNDQQIINQVLSGDTNAFAVLVDQYKDLVFSLALRMLKHREESEEVAQDTFVKVFQSLSKFKGDSKLSTWIYRVTYNSCLDRIKRNKRKYKEVAITEFNTSEIKSLDTAFDRLAEKERKQAIKRCLELLPSDDAFLLTLFYFEEQSLEEILKVLGISANHAKVKLFRSRKKMAVILKENLEPELLAVYERSKQ